VTLRIGRGIELPIDTVTQSIAILARRGAGKTYAASVIVEEAIDAQVPVVVLDPTGAWWGLRSSVDGEKPGLPVVIFGGDHGDMDLDPSAGTTFAEVVLEHPGAYIFDLSAFTSKAAEHTFAATFLDRLYRGKKPDSGPLFVVVDEADVFAPQQPREKGDQLKSLGALESIVRRGRIKGLGCLLITQRAAVLNKNVLTQTEILIVMQTTGPQDRAAIDEWIKGNGTAEERDGVLSTLASLEQGEAWLWSPSFLRTLARIRVRPRRTFDSSRTPGTGEVAITPTTFAKVDLDALDARIAAAKQQQKANDPRELRKRIVELERQVAQRPTEQVERVVEKVVEVPVLNGQVEKLAETVRQLVGVGSVLQGIGESITEAISRVHAIPVPQGSFPPAVVHPEPRPRLTVAAPPTDDLRLDAGARRMLVALARLHPTPLLRSQLGTLADVAWTSGTFRGYLSRLRVAQLIEEPDKNTVALSAQGVEMMGSDLGSGAPDVSELVEMWNRKLDAGARRMLAVLVSIYPEWISRADLGEQVGIEPTSGTFRGYLSRLRVNRLLEESSGSIRAGEALFIGGER
jgi:hypothetical protein